LMPPGQSQLKLTGFAGAKYIACCRHRPNRTVGGNLPPRYSCGGPATLTDSHAGSSNTWSLQRLTRPFRNHGARRARTPIADMGNHRLRATLLLTVPRRADEALRQGWRTERSGRCAHARCRRPFTVPHRQRPRAQAVTVIRILLPRSAANHRRHRAHPPHLTRAMTKDLLHVVAAGHIGREDGSPPRGK